MKVNSNKILLTPLNRKYKNTKINSSDKLIEILHTNDTHANIIDEEEKTGLAYVSGYVKHKRDRNPDLLYIDSGDFLSGGKFYNQVLKGMPVVKILNKMKVDITTLGNHEFDFSDKYLEKLLPLMRFNVISSNIKFSKKTPIKPYKIIKRNGVKLGFIGLSPQELRDIEPDYNLKGVEVLNPEKVLGRYIKELKEKDVDVIILVSHSGLEEDEKLAKLYPDIDIILGGHSHTILKKPVKVGKTIIVQTGRSAKYIGDLLIHFDNSNHAYEIDYKLDNVDKYGIDKDVKNYYDSLKDKYKNLAYEKVANLDRDYTRSSNNQSLIGSLVTDAIREATGADFVFVQSGHIRSDLKKGQVFYKDIFEVLPFLDELSLYKVKGDVIYKILEKSLYNKDKVLNPLQSSNFLQISGLKVYYKKVNDKYKILKIEDLKGKQIDKDKFYKISGSYLLMHGGAGYPELASVKLVKENIIREDLALKQFLLKRKILNIDEKRYIQQGMKDADK